MYEYELTTEEVMDLSPEDRISYVEDRKAYRRWKSKKLKEQMVWGITMCVLSVVIPTGASVMFIPLGAWTIYCALKRDVVIC